MNDKARRFEIRFFGDVCSAPCGEGGCLARGSATAIANDKDGGHK